jgi:hypothetical protein
MDTVKQWALGITVAAIAGGVVLILSPSGGTEKIVRTAVSLFLLCVILTPFMSGVDVDAILGNIRTNYEEPDASAVKGTLEEQMKQALSEKLNEILVNNGIKDASINIDISIDKDNNMSIDKVNIKADKAYSSKFDKAKGEIKSELGIEVEIGVVN